MNIEIGPNLAAVLQVIATCLVFVAIAWALRKS